MSKKAPLQRQPFSRKTLLVFILAFAAIGGYILLHSFAAGSTFGITTTGQVVDTATIDLKVVSPYTSTQAGTINKVSGYLSGNGGASGSETLKAIVYADNGGSPGTLLGASSPVTFSAGQAAAWVDFTFSSPVSVPSGTVWMGYISTGSNNL